MEIDAKRGRVSYTTEELARVANELRNIKTRSKNAGTHDNTIAVNEVAGLLGLVLPSRDND